MNLRTKRIQQHFEADEEIKFDEVMNEHLANRARIK
jgi:hypothetical protein